MLKNIAFHRKYMFLIVFIGNSLHLSSPKNDQINLLMKNIINSLKSTMRLLKNVLYVAKKVFLLM